MSQSKSRRARAATAFLKWQHAVAETGQVGRLSRAAKPRKSQPSTSRVWRAKDVRVSPAVAAREKPPGEG
jgi:hypothetical protein